MGGRHNRSRRRRAKAEAEAAILIASDSPEKAFPSSGASATFSERPVQRKIPFSKLTESSPMEEEEDPRRVLRRSLLGQIRGYYLDSISRLPTTDLTTTLARGLLIAGHCYGPLHPAHNILLNAVWHSPATGSMCPSSATRSLDGLVASLRYHCPALSHDDAIWHLNLSRADLRAAVASARGAAPSLFRPAELDVKAAFQVAAKTARHPKPAAFALFASSVIPSVERDAVSLLNNKRRLSSADILCLSTMLLPSPLPDELPHPPLQDRCRKAFEIITRKRKLFIIWYERWVKIADAALRKYAQQTGSHYQLHIIYGTGTLKDEFNLDRSFHINFMAWPKDDPSSAREAPAFFFAEAVRGPDPGFCEENVTSCCTVQPSPSEVDSCHSCLTKKFRIDHPDDYENFDGGLDCPITLEVDYRCFDPDRDIDLVEYLDQDFHRYVSSLPWLRGHKDDGDLSILGYCSGM
ncbi:hypothetical protein BRADI_2g56435v3 [Brachypodium distachyon]|uniref:Uncharacterized protein n=1 Tax=Brachypodium distachyon TaxID=15368 RepID=A0A2K2DG73_BRADI|nr:hypothetical protein BRADI_2g56435v3 [Brachypodium distachyon]